MDSPTGASADASEAPLPRRLAEAEARLLQLETERAAQAALIARLRVELAACDVPSRLANELPVLQPAGIPRTPAAKVALFRSIFRGRDDVYPKLWQNPRTGKKGYSPACANEWIRGVCEKPRVRCGECPNQAFLAVTDQVLFDHLQGKHVVGVYPLLVDETCWLLAVDFDKESWREDVLAFLEACREADAPAYVERSRSGNGAHVWFYFSTPVPAAKARQMGTCLLTAAMDRRHQLGLASYDRLFPNQDTLPRGGFGNLIALPLQHGPRQEGNTLFLDDALEPFPDQWRLLAGVRRVALDAVNRIVEQARQRGSIIGLRIATEPADDGDGEDPNTLPWTQPRAALEKHRPIPEPIPAEVRAILAHRLFIEKIGLPSSLLNQMQRLAAFQNPEFYKRQKMRLSTALTPRAVCCAADLPAHLSLPRGCLDELQELLHYHGSRLKLDDQREEGEPIALAFRGQLTAAQEVAAEAILRHDIGVHVAPPGSGKTVIGTYMVARRARSALILVHRRPLLDQWRAQLALFLGLDPKLIGRIGGGKDEATGSLDVAMIQSLVSRSRVDERVGKYGHVIVDECHHAPAFLFERLLSEVRARYLLGLTATPQRRDGHHPITHMQLGPVRHRLTSSRRDPAGGITRRLLVRETSFRLPEGRDDWTIQEIYRLLAADRSRNVLIIDDVIRSLEEGRSPILLTERKDHLESLAAELRRAVRNVVVLKGGRTPRECEAAIRELAGIPAEAERLIIATGRYIGEGFDDARLDTLFLALPVSWKGTLVQYAGRLHRESPGKAEVRVHDYHDAQVPMLARMFQKRRRGYRTLSYEAE
jgi:superfamily II DNA or RNA helicase